MAGRKRTRSLEERLAAIRTTPEEEPAPTAEAPASETPPAAPPEPSSTTEPVGDPEPESPQWFRAETPVPTPLFPAAEGDTFLPAGSAAALANRVDVGVAVQAAVRQLWPELEKVDKPVELETTPEETPLLSKLLGRSWMSSTRRASQEARETPDATPHDEPAPDEAAAAAPAAGDVSELNEIIAEIAEIAEVTAPAPWVPVRGRVPKPTPLAERDGAVEREAFMEAGDPEPEALIVEPESLVEAEPEPEVEPEPELEAIVVEAEPEPELEVIVVEVEPEPEPELVVEPESEPEPTPEPEPEPEPEPVPSEQEEIDELVAEVVAAPEPEVADERVEDNPWVRPLRTVRFGRIGTTLIDRGLITNDQLDEALEIQRSSGRRVGDILVELQALSSFELARVLADHMGVPFTDLRTKPPDPIIAALLPEDVARRYDALAIQRWNDQLVIAMANPTDLFALDDLQMVTHQPIIAAMAVKEDLRAAIDRVYRVSIVETVDAAKVDYSPETQAAAVTVEDAEQGPIVGLVNALMSQAITDRASDLHIEPASTHIAIRMRIDGVLHDSSTVPLELLRPIVSRVKILAGLDIAQTRLAQDGRFSLTIDGRSVDVRVVTMPTAAGEAVILRLLDPVRDALGLPSLGLSEAEAKRFMPAFTSSQGAVFIVGPTGSGKTSTIYAVLSEVNSRTKSIVSIENPVEFRVDGIKQMQINPRAGVTFPSALPSVLRSDPDIVFIGEVRDSETASIAADAAITGHLVLSTLHATRAAAAPMRLVEMGVEPYLVASALTLVASQRLARKLCGRSTST